MKKFIIGLLVAILMFCSIGVEESAAQEIESIVNPIDVGEWIQKIPNMKNGVVYSFDSSEIKYVLTTPIAEDIFRASGFNLEAGGVIEDNEVIVALTYKVINLKEKTTLPILDLIELNVGGYIGLKNFLEEDGNEFDAGISLTAINVKF